MKIVVGIDGSEQSLRAVAWCATHADALGAEVVAVHAIELPLYPPVVGLYSVPLQYSSEDNDTLRTVMTEQWCEPLSRMKVAFKPVVVEGYPAEVIRDTANAEDADLVVVGRRGRGGFKELVLGSTSHQLAHHFGRALVIIP
jgi:nucleotide-binding universal stress UspA family protein